jgi:nucleoside-diphosphate-sugar epimerase
MPQHVVVTGAGGFVGGFLARSLAAQGYTVTAITRRAEEGTSEDRLSWRQVDLRDETSLPPKFDALLHCAAEIPARCADPVELYRRNMAATQSVYRQAVNAGARTVLFTSSMSVYGAISAPVVTEDTQPLNPDAYGRSKRDGELALESSVAEQGLYSGLSLRLSGTVGKGSHNNFLSVALARVLAGQNVAISRPDGLFNNIVYVGDLAEFAGRWIAQPNHGYTVANLAAPKPMRIRDVISLLFSCTGMPERIDIVEGQKEPFLILLDRALACGYAPRDVRSSLEAFVSDCRTP